MKYFFKLNIVSILYALVVFIPLELMFNVYRISRLTNWEIGLVNILTGILFIYGREDPILKEFGGMFNQMSRVGMNRLRTRDGSSYLNCSTD
jgi:hypothetical protein